MNLTWTYVETVCDLTAQARRASTKSIIREIRASQRDYESFRQPFMTNDQKDTETLLGENFETGFHDDFFRLDNVLRTILAPLSLTADERYLVMAIWQALTLMESVRLYAKWCDRQIASFDVWVCECCMVQVEFMRLYTLVPQCLKDFRLPTKQLEDACQMSAKIIVGRLHKCQINVAPD